MCTCGKPTCPVGNKIETQKQRIEALIADNTRLREVLESIAAHYGEDYKPEAFEEAVELARETVKVRTLAGPLLTRR